MINIIMNQVDGHGQTLLIIVCTFTGIQLIPLVSSVYLQGYGFVGVKVGKVYVIMVVNSGCITTLFSLYISFHFGVTFRSHIFIFLNHFLKQAPQENNLI